MSRSFGLAAYRALSRRSADRSFEPSEARPGGQLLWMHASESKNLLAITDLAQRVTVSRPGLNILITLPDSDSFEEARVNWIPHENIRLDKVPDDHPAAAAKFWAHWTPDMAIWAFGDLRPNLLDTVHEAGCPIALIDADEAGFDNRRDRWLPDLTRQLLDPFVALMVRSQGAARKLEALGLDPARIEETPPLQAGGLTLPCRDADLLELSKILAGRPVWLAGNLQADEVETVLVAHRQAIRFSHRLLLILHPAHNELVDSCTAKIADFGFRMTDWPSGAEPDDATQVLLAPDHADLGLFYRIAPVSFMGSSLVPGYNGRNPFEAATLGSAVLYGPNVRRYMPFYSRLAKAGAARIVKDAETLGAAVTRLIAPDQAAAMAHAGWDVVSQGADLTDRVIELVNATLDEKQGAANARA